MKTYIYCTKPKNKSDLLIMDNDSGKYYCEGRHSGRRSITILPFVPIECEVKEALILSPTYKDYSLNPNHCDFDDVSLVDELAKRMGFGKYDDNSDAHEFLDNYSQGKDLYAYHLENVNPVELHLSDFYEDEDCTKPLTKAPQSYRFAYRRHDCADEEARMINKWSDQEGHECFQDVYGWYYVEKCLIFSDHAQYCAKILNGEKDLEVRKTRIAEGVTFK